METWRHVWREGFAPLLSRAALEALAGGLRRDDLRLGQGFTTQPPPLLCVADWKCEGGCFLVYSFWQGERGGDATVGECEEAFARACFEADERLGEVGACRWALNWFDETPRGEMRTDLLAEVELALAGRIASEAA